MTRHSYEGGYPEARSEIIYQLWLASLQMFSVLSEIRQFSCIMTSFPNRTEMSIWVRGRWESYAADLIEIENPSGRGH